MVTKLIGDRERMKNFEDDFQTLWSELPAVNNNGIGRGIRAFPTVEKLTVATRRQRKN